MTEMTHGESPTLDGPTIKPGIRTTEFWQAIFVHLFASVSALAVFFNVNLSHLSVVQGLIPIAALVASFIAQAAYHDKRANLKGQQISAWAEVNVARVQALQPVVSNYLPMIQSVGSLIAPAQAKQVQDVFVKAEAAARVADAAWHQDMRDVPSPVPAPLDIAINTTPVVEAQALVVPVGDDLQAVHIADPTAVVIVSVAGTGTPQIPPAQGVFDPDSPSAAMSQP